MDLKKLVRRDSSQIALDPEYPIRRRPCLLRGLAATTSALVFFCATIHLAQAAQEPASVQFQTPIPLVAPGSPGSPDGPFGLALDGTGDLFVSDYNNNRVVEIPVGCTSTACQFTLPTSGLSGPTGLTVDGDGNVFIADYGNNRVVEVPWMGSGYGAQVTLPSTGQDEPGSVAVDAAGDVYIANFDHSGTTASKVIELPWTGSAYGAPITVANWLSGPFGLAFDTSGDLFIADEGAGQVVELPPGCSSSACQTIVASGLPLSPGPTAVSVDEAGDLFIADGQVLEVPSGCSSSTCQINIGSSFNVGLGALGVAVDGQGNIYVADYGTNLVLAINQNSFNIGSVTLGNTRSVTAYINFNSSVTLNATTPYSVLTQGVSGLDFRDGGSGTCAAMTYNSGDSCSIQINFSPQFSGSVDGAVVLFDASGNEIGTGYLTGTGAGPQLTFRPGTRSSVGVGLASSPGVAIDRMGNIFVADKISRTVEELLAPGYSTSRQLGAAYGFVNPVSLAVDGASNVYVADTGSPSIEEIHAPSYTVVSTLGSGFSSPSGVAVDSRGNLYVADTGHNAVKEIIEASDYTTVNTLASTFNAPGGVAVDSSENVYVADTGNDAVKQILADDGNIPPSPTINNLSSAFSAPSGVAVDDMGNVYVADTGNDAVDELTAFTGFTQVNQLGSGLSGPSGISVDSGGNVYVGSSADTRIVELDYADLPTLNFEASIGSASNPQALTLTDYGNADLMFPSPASGYNPSVSTDFSIEASGVAGSPCPRTTAYSGAATLAAGASCVDQVTFTPPGAGTVNGSMVLTDNNLNMTGSTQTISLKGNAVLMSFVPTSLASAQVGAAYSQTIAASGGTAPYSYQVSTGALPTGMTMENSGLLSGTPSAAGSFTFTVTATDAYGLTGNQAYSLTIGAPTITVAPTLLPAAQANAAYKQTLTASGGTEPYTFKIASGVLPAGISLSSAGLLSGTPTASGSFNFNITATDSSTGTGAPFSAASSYTLSVIAPAITIAPATLPSGQVGAAYTMVSMTAIGGTAPYSYKVTAGSLPAGLTLSSAGLLSGTPSAGGSFSFTVTATDKASFSGSQNYSITVGAPAITFTSTSLPAAQVNVAYNQTLTVTGGTSPYSYEVTAGFLPAGLTFNNATATLSGTPTAGGSFPITVTATDSSTGSGPYTTSLNLMLIVNPGTARLTFASISPQIYGNPPFAVSASSSSSGAITFSIVSGPAIFNPATGLVILSGAGQVTIEANQSATTSYISTVAQMPIEVARQASSTSIIASSLSVGEGQNVTLTASVSAAVMGTPTGTVSFFDGGTQIGTPVALTDGTAQLVSSAIPPGQNTISATYNGDGNFLGSSSSLSAPVVVSPSDFSFAVTGSSSTTIMPGGTATFNFALAPTSADYPGTVSFSVEGAPAGAISVMSATSVPSDSGPQTVTLTIRSSSSNSASVRPLRSGRHYAPVGFAILLPFLGLLRLRLRRKFLSGLGLMVLLAAGTLTTWPLCGCGGAVSGVLGQSYSVAVTAKSGTEQHTAFVSVTVN
jgi:streptogramin lyase